jgi:hypothetical protein
MGPWEQLIIQLIVMAKIWRGLLLFLEKRNRENWRSYLMNWNIKILKVLNSKDLPKYLNNYGQPRLDV